MPVHCVDNTVVEVQSTYCSIDTYVWCLLLGQASLQKLIQQQWPQLTSSHQYPGAPPVCLFRCYWRHVRTLILVFIVCGFAFFFLLLLVFFFIAAVVHSGASGKHSEIISLGKPLITWYPHCELWCVFVCVQLWCVGICCCICLQMRWCISIK